MPIREIPLTRATYYELLEKKAPNIFTRQTIEYYMEVDVPDVTPAGTGPLTEAEKKLFAPLATVPPTDKAPLIAPAAPPAMFPSLKGLPPTPPAVAKFFKSRTVQNRTRYSKDLIKLAPNWKFLMGQLDGKDNALLFEISDFIQKYPSTTSGDLRRHMVTRDPRCKKDHLVGSKLFEDTVSNRIGRLIRSGILIRIPYTETPALENDNAQQSECSTQ